VHPGLSYPLKVIAYPACLVVGIATYYGLRASGAPLSYSPYLAVVAAFALISLFEWLIPYRPDWKPAARDTVTDLIFMSFVQVLLPLALGWLSAYVLLHIVGAAGLSLNIWPKTWPVWAQVLLKILVGDFLRYWLHRWSHTVPWLWRLHEVHHAPPKLYAINVFRFYPGDKALQYVLDTLIFLVLGIGPEVLALYFVVYATSGLLQHANIDLRLGVFNYVLSGPEVHRWHHHDNWKVSAHNFAHTFIVWDLIFGTYHRPKNESVGNLGLGYDYPQGFWAQLWAPWRCKS
jgi:sterol desaturase/sphingolipid hydroxylase (fatty acid hydroxylase superfamily)